MDVVYDCPQSGVFGIALENKIVVRIISGSGGSLNCMM